MEPITHEEAFGFLVEAPVAHIAVICDGEAWVTPISFVVDGDHIVFRTKPGKRMRGISQNPKVCIEVSRYDTETGDWLSVIVRGVATETTDSETKTRVAGLLMEKYAKALGSPLGRGGLQPMIGLPQVIRVSIDEISGMSSGRGLAPRTRPGRF